MVLCIESQGSSKYHLVNIDPSNDDQRPVKGVPSVQVRRPAEPPHTGAAEPALQGLPGGVIIYIYIDIVFYGVCMSTHNTIACKLAGL